MGSSVLSRPSPEEQTRWGSTHTTDYLQRGLGVWFISSYTVCSSRRTRTIVYHLYHLVGVHAPLILRNFKTVKLNACTFSFGNFRNIFNLQTNDVAKLRFLRCQSQNIGHNLFTTHFHGRALTYSFPHSFRMLPRFPQSSQSCCVKGTQSRGFFFYFTFNYNFPFRG